MPIVGLANVYDPTYSNWDGSDSTTKALNNWRNAVQTNQRKGWLTIHTNREIVTRLGNGNDVDKKTKTASHGGFDNDVNVISKTLERITGGKLALPVDDLVGF
jgi:hypothetical protein